MGLNIKNERTHELVRELAELTGRSQTSAVEEAVRHRLSELRKSGGPAGMRWDRVQGIITDFSARLTSQQRDSLSDTDSELYDADGLPR